APADEPPEDAAHAGEPQRPRAEGLHRPPAGVPVPVEPPAAPVETAASGSLPWVRLGGALWLGGAVCWFAVAAARVRRFGRVLRHGTDAPAELQAEAEALAARLGLARCPRVWLVPGTV